MIEKAPIQPPIRIGGMEIGAIGLILPFAALAETIPTGTLKAPLMKTRVGSIEEMRGGLEGRRERCIRMTAIDGEMAGI